ncbi:KTSC domain-containing protein [Pseudomonas aeruginosa]|uniref:KTSC domain-containing protein n=1 Tax=Pseudomonas aeruginosa TaxID=287 RepID=UPI001C977FDB|nr:KTSC domain-containing protein [Pseudomonas aeruginosa]MBY5286883.1 KTSC domain-containing protein [Pseudomonas aeruginosa]MEA8564110.1 KTSC domain-containing protein [Pseudomonas aeruginosa]MEA8576329.1 KTSC domain-containing protein [Pseudomonas aeruginosa]MEA8609410.1 KTSC domain-containing protein [Pseudomonas aeruginosa]
MERTPVTSSNISSIGYDADSQVLEIEFNSGAVYEYSGVPAGEHAGLMNADSKGTYFNANIKNRYSFSKH